MADLRVLAAYLAAGVEVQHPMWGRGRFVGLPCCTVGEYQTVDIAYPLPEGFGNPDYRHLADVRLVLYAPEDLHFNSPRYD